MWPDVATDDDAYDRYRDERVLIPHHSTPDDGLLFPFYWPKEERDDDDCDGGTPG